MNLNKKKTKQNERNSNEIKSGEIKVTQNKEKN